MKSIKVLFASLVALAFITMPAFAAPPATPKNVDVSQLSNNESEEAIAVNPTNPNNIVIVTNVVVPAAGMFAAVSFDGGSTWSGRIIGNNDNLGAASGQTIGYVEGREAASPFDEPTPIDAINAALVDEIFYDAYLR